MKESRWQHFYSGFIDKLESIDIFAVWYRKEKLLMVVFNKENQT